MSNRLTILPTLRIKTLPNNQIIITRKFVEAILLYKKLWSGSVQVLLEETTGYIEDVDKQTIQITDLPFELSVVSYDDKNLINYLEKSTVLASASYRQNHISQLCQTALAPCVYTAEYTLRTRRQIVDVTTSNILLRLRRRLWEENQERSQQKAIALANGVHCNGVPIYEEYRSLNQNCLLFFDTRITEDLLATEDDIDQRTQCWSQNTPLRLLFSGRLTLMKGADHLLEVAQELERLGVNFKLFISGSGALENAMEQRIQENGLSDRVTMMGVPNFRTEFLPFVKSNIDLFVCCHRQGDPSCTYIETMSCGVPIVGYANEAFEGMVEYSNAGWLVEIDQPKLLAAKIFELDRCRNSIKSMSYASLKFARTHTFNQTFQARVQHLQTVATKTNQAYNPSLGLEAGLVPE
ncbi:glycosyltransferase [Leptolyngbya sp. FACHB-36]|uniref:glycosyltransferase n=1 Tax=Leptolyngbya sp. FACHB-36 TaxID=2692808 RepID=UPI001680BF54|nr:glycosyltransferase [Leptolyngbya sp. FACHB-36]MBD2019888.1 glycosyltransferase [Leptolyngbya sp. FACHB-36]